HQEDDEGQTDGQGGDDVSRDLDLGSQHADLAFDPHALADRVPDRRQDLGQVAADLVLDVDRGYQEIEVFARNPAQQVFHRLLVANTETDLTNDAPELGCHRIGGLPGHHVHCLQQAITGAERVRHQ